METKIGTITTVKSKKILRSEVLLDNFIERDLQSAFKPLHYMQSLLICSKYSIRDNFITSNTFMYDFIGIFGFIVCRSINLYNLVILMGDWKSTEYLFNWSGLFDYASYTFGFLLNYYINIKFCDDNILMVLFFAVFAISHGLMNMGVVIKLNLALAGAGIQGSIFIFITQVWFVKNIVLIAYLSVVCERFYKAIEEVPGAFMLLTKRHGRSDTQKRVCKNIERIQRTRFMKLDACGVFTVDATLPLDLISFTTTYTVVLLQFSI
ncbi:uncharacterized protein LOC126911097 [Spodoptera frugiperda]|uniref:Uncharacterized protein LOC126911097 n=1 Tax=Spodoptera frugiperda TaxID=7108 RepID=A0A9R0EWI3_SPOFR|nr:uncharacterized protein LOC126911097 [Spodoptera frugiperda]